VDALKMSDYGITKDELPEVVKNARHTMGGLFNVDPAVLSDEDCLKIYEESYR
jgi:alcohol dehydrogenase